jgi:hypothetical protein
MLTRLNHSTKTKSASVLTTVKEMNKILLNGIKSHEFDFSGMALSADDMNFIFNALFEMDANTPKRLTFDRCVLNEVESLRLKLLVTQHNVKANYVGQRRSGLQTELNLLSIIKHGLFNSTPTNTPPLIPLEPESPKPQ